MSTTDFSGTVGRARRGVALLWVLMVFGVVVGVGVMAVDVGMVMVARSELQSAVDNVARTAGHGLTTNPTEAVRLAEESAADNPVGGQTLRVTAADVEFGIWNHHNRTFVPLEGKNPRGATALRVTGRLDEETGNGVGLLLGPVLGYRTAAMSASAVVTIGEPHDVVVPATACPYLAGCKDAGRSHIIPFTGSSSYTAPIMDTRTGHHDPLKVDVPLRAGGRLYFRDVAGVTGDYSSGGQTYGLDGNTARASMAQTATNGINTTRAPLNALCGIFLDDDDPITTPMQPQLSYGTADSRNFLTQAPRIKQIFFIGDGVTDDGVLQSVVVPEGATRLFLGVMDEKGWWWDNFGDYSTNLFVGGKVTLVK